MKERRSERVGGIETFADLEKIRIEILKKKIQDGIKELNNDPKKQWTSIRFERPLLETIERLTNKEMAQKVIKTGNSSQACPNCGSNVSSYYCSVCGQKLSY
jgi:hypothetical protein